MVSVFANTGTLPAPTTGVRGRHYRHVAAIICTELTVNVPFSCVDEPIAERNESLTAFEKALERNHFGR